MKLFNKTFKRLSLYVIGLFLLALGVSLSIEADLGVSPVSSLAYGLALVSGLSVGMMTIIANIIFIIVQVILSRRFDLRASIVQLIIAFLFGFYMDVTLFLMQFIPTPETLLMRWGVLIISLFVIAIGLFGYFNARFPLAPYDELTHVISEKFNMKFSNAKVSSDLINVGVAGLLCIIFIHSLGSIGIGTIVSAYFIGKILGWFRKHFQKILVGWVYKEKGFKDDEPVKKDNLTFPS